MVGITFMVFITFMGDTTTRVPSPIQKQFHIPNAEEIEARLVNRQFHVPSAEEIEGRVQFPPGYFFHS